VKAWYILQFVQWLSVMLFPFVNNMWPETGGQIYMIFYYLLSFIAGNLAIMVVTKVRKLCKLFYIILERAGRRGAIGVLSREDARRD
jgi:hypothetical protein